MGIDDPDRHSFQGTTSDQRPSSDNSRGFSLDQPEQCINAVQPASDNPNAVQMTDEETSYREDQYPEKRAAYLERPKSKKDSACGGSVEGYDSSESFFSDSSASTVSDNVTTDTVEPDEIPRDQNSLFQHSLLTRSSSKSQRSRPLNCCSWSRRRIQVAAMGCTSAVLVCTIRLLLDSEPTAYLIHSLVILVDMLLIHLFTYSPWLSLSGELLTILFAALFHVTKETVFELLETTLIAALCSMHMICSRNRHKKREQQLEEDLSGLHISLFLKSQDEDEDLMLDSTERGVSEHLGPDRADLLSSHRTLTKKKGRFAVFFEHFLDGSAGVMYTSFLGLIIDELIQYGSDGKGNY